MNCEERSLGNFFKLTHYLDEILPAVGQHFCEFGQIYYNSYAKFLQN